MLLSGIIAALTSLLIPIIILLLLLPNACYVVEQQHGLSSDRHTLALGYPHKEIVHNKKLPLLGALSFNGAGERTSAYPLRGSAPASAACRRPRQLAKNAPRFLYARSFTGSSPCDGPITKKLPLLGALSFNGAGERT